MISEQHTGLSRLSPPDKCLLVKELWDDLEADPGQISVSDAMTTELDRRMENYKNNSIAVST